jgi:hypothetical protein
MASIVQTERRPSAGDTNASDINSAELVADEVYSLIDASTASPLHKSSELSSAMTDTTLKDMSLVFS